MSPGYADLNPEYDQPHHAKPVWGLAKSMPRVVRPGMIPTREEVVEAALNPELPAENSNRVGADVDPNELEAGRMDASLDPAKVRAQVKDARKQRENNFLNYVKTGVRTKTVRSKAQRTTSRLSRSSSRRERWAEQVREEREAAHLPTTFEEDEPESDEEDLRPGKAGPSDGPPRYSVGTGDAAHHETSHQDHASVTTVDPDEDDSENEKFPDEMEPLLEDLMEDEVFNNHTSWSVWRTEWREGLAEMLGAMVQITIGLSANLSVMAAGNGNPNTLNWAWGFATMIAIYVSGGISGAHLNPTLTMTLWFYRGFPKRKMPEFWAGQFLGAFLGPFIAYGVYYAAIQNFIANNANGEATVVGYFVTNPGQDYVGQATAFFNEFVGTAFLVIIIMALGDDQNAPPGAGMNSFIVGLVITALTFAFSFNTGMALNPARDFGPRLALLCLGYGGDLFTDPYWFFGPFAATLCGAFIGAGVYDFMIFTGGESPINYPFDRTKRAAIKSKNKWAKKLHLKKKDEEHAATS